MRTLVLLKPSAVKRGLCGEIIKRYEQAGLRLISGKLQQFPEGVFAQLYQEHEGKEFYRRLITSMSSAPIMALLLEGPEGIVEKVRTINGATDPVKANPGTIRGDFASNMQPDNLVHASDSVESAEREIGIFFSK